MGRPRHVPTEKLKYDQRRTYEDPEYAEKKKKQRKEHRKRQRSSFLGIMKHRLGVVKARARSSGLDYDLSLEWLLSQPNTCPVTGSPFVTPVSGHGPLSPSFDRIDSSKGYTKDNTRIVAYWFNIAKREWNDQEMQDLIISTAEAIKKRRSVA